MWLSKTAPISGITVMSTFDVSFSGEDIAWCLCSGVYHFAFFGYCVILRHFVVMVSLWIRSKKTSTNKSTLGSVHESLHGEKWLCNFLQIADHLAEIPPFSANSWIPGWHIFHLTEFGLCIQCTLCVYFTDVFRDIFPCFWI